MHIVNTYEDVKRNSVPLWINPPAVIQIPIQESKGTRQARPPHGDEEENLRSAALQFRNPRNTVKALQIGSGGKEVLQKVIMTETGGVRPGAHQSTEGNRRERSPRDDDVKDLRDVIEGLLRKERSQPEDRSGSREREEPSSRGTDPNEHRTRRHKYDTNLPPDRKHSRAPVNLVGDDKTHEQMLQWLSKDPTRLADAQKDVARWKEYLAIAVQNPVFPFFVSMTYGSKSLCP
jgi:hypothetical protein